jgi:hypothetical protein
MWPIVVAYIIEFFRILTMTTSYVIFGVEG